MVTKREIDLHFEKLIFQDENKEKLEKLPTNKRWEYLAEHSIKLKTIGEEEEVSRDTFFYYIAEIKKNPYLDLKGLSNKLENTDVVGLRKFILLNGFQYIFDSLGIFLENKLSGGKNVESDIEHVRLIIACVISASRKSKVVKMAGK